MNTKKPAARAIRRPLGFVTITRIVRESTPIESGPEGVASVGAYIDEYLSRAAAHGHSIQTVELNFDLEQWEQLATEVYAGYVDPDFAD
jgi:hypothetical protein